MDSWALGCVHVQIPALPELKDFPPLPRVSYGFSSFG